MKYYRASHPRKDAKVPDVSGNDSVPIFRVYEDGDRVNSRNVG